MNGAPSFVVAAPASGAGKTTVVAGLLRAFRRRGSRVQPFKAGPDYIDPSYHQRAAGRPCRNLDTWMIPPAALRELYRRATADVDLAVIEGMMGLFDGREGGEDGSTAQLAKLLRAPVVVVIDVGRSSRTAGAIALGCQRFDPDLAVAGFILNGVGGEGHRRWAGDAIAEATGLPVFGWLAHRDDLALPERHLGLIPTTEQRIGEDFFDRLADQIERSFDLDALLELRGPDAGPSIAGPSLFPVDDRPVVATIGLAVDEAFSFYYEDNLDLLRAWGARLIPFSPLRDTRLPPDLDALYLGGGFPELYAERLAANHALREAIRAAAAAGMPIYGECGGLMYLSEGIVDFDRRRHPMVGLVPGWSAMTSQRLTLGYREVRARRDTALLRQGQTARGHEFHWSALEAAPPAEASAYDLAGASARYEGFAKGNLLASYCHLHFGSNPDLAPTLVATAEAWRKAGRLHSAGPFSPPSIQSIHSPLETL
ncbi:MAG: cobyrinate a,c-diamide synthase [Chloroflexota bacterium]